MDNKIKYLTYPAMLIYLLFVILVSISILFLYSLLLYSQISKDAGARFTHEILIEDRALLNYHANTNIAGDTLATLIENSEDQHPELFFLVHDANDKGVVRQYGTVNKVKAKKEFSVAELFHSHREYGLPLTYYEDLTPQEIRIELMSFQERDNKIVRDDSMEVNHWLRFYPDNDLKSSLESPFLTTFTNKTNLNEETISFYDTMDIDESKQYLSVAIMDNETHSLTGFYFEEIGTPIEFAPVALKLYSENIYNIHTQADFD